MNYEYNFDVSVGSKTIHCRAFTLREYKELMHAKISGGLKEKVEEILLSCTDAKDLNRQEAELLLVKLWAHSTGEVNSEAIYTCECGKENIVALNINYAQLDDSEDLIYDFKNFKIKFKYPKIFNDSNIALMITTCIDYIIVGDEKLSIEDLTDVELNDLLTAITTEDAERIAAMLLKPSIYLAVPIQCECGKHHVYTIKGLKEFFRLL